MAHNHIHRYNIYECCKLYLNTVHQSENDRHQKQCEEAVIKIVIFRLIVTSFIKKIHLVLNIFGTNEKVYTLLHQYI